VPTIVQLTLAKWLTQGVGENKADRKIAFTQTCAVATPGTASEKAAEGVRSKWRKSECKIPS
jgi:hypothetical protein